MTYTIIENKKIGSGGFGEVFKVRDDTGRTMAVKIIPPNKLSYVELDILTRLKSPYVIRSIRDPIVEIQNSYGIGLELKEECVSKLNTKDLPYYQLKRIMVGVIFGLRCLHSKGFIHKDISRRNILYDKNKEENYRGYLADFGVSVRCLNSKKGVRTDKLLTTNMPIEILEKRLEGKKNFVYNEKTDIWSLGITFLEMIDKKYKFSSNRSLLNFYEGLDQDFITGKVRLYNRNKKISKKEELYLIELLVNMLKKDPLDRMSTDDLMYLNFIKTTSIPYDCEITKPSEFIVIPVSESNLKLGVEKIKNFFEQNQGLLLENYFLALQIFTRILGKVVVNTEEKLSDMVEVSIITARNYYDRSVNAGYEGGIILKGEVGYSPYFYAASYIEDLVVLDEMILKEENFLTMYNLLNPHELFYHFREIYNYSGEKMKSISYENFKTFSMPHRKEDSEGSILSTSEYSSVMDGVIDEKESLLAREKRVEKIFLEMILKFITENVTEKFNKDYPDIYDLAKQFLSDNNAKKKQVYDTIRDRDIFSHLMGLNEYFNYGLIILNSENIPHHVFVEREFVVVRKNNTTSLLRVYPEEKKVIHYYSEPEKLIEEFYTERGFSYSTNFEYGINTCCRVTDSCVLFTIFYNLFKKQENYNVKCVSEETNFAIFLSLFV